MEETFDVAVIGSGPAGYVAAIRLSQLGMKTVCIEEKELGGTCLQVGCIPSKTLLHASELIWKVQQEGKVLGIDGSIFPDWDRMQDRKKEVIGELEHGILGLFKKNKVTLIKGTASFSSKDTLVISGKDERKIQAKHFLIATGSSPIALPFLPFDEERVVSSTGALSLKKIPKRLIVVGAGVIGVELGSVFKRLGADVHFVEFMDTICPGLEVSLSKALHESLERQGMRFSLSTKVVEGSLGEDIRLTVENKEGIKEDLFADVVLVCIGRKPFTERLKLENAGISVDAKGFIPVDSNFRTKQPHILAVGDVIDGPMLAHKASEEGVAVAEHLASLRPSIQYVTIPSIVYTYPEVASVGLSEKDAKKLGFSFLVGTSLFKSNPRAKCSFEEEGFVKVLVDQKTDKFLGIHIIGPHASELIAAPATALCLGKTSAEVGDICMAHPTLGEAFKEAVLSIHKKAIHK